MLPNSNITLYHPSHIQQPTSGIGAFSPGILRLGYDGGGPYLCIAISHGGGNKFLFYDDNTHIVNVKQYLYVRFHTYSNIVTAITIKPNKSMTHSCTVSTSVTDTNFAQYNYEKQNNLK